MWLVHGVIMVYMYQVMLSKPCDVTLSSADGVSD